MKYDFTTVVDRSKKGSEKWNRMYESNTELLPGVVPFSVADMEFLPPPEMKEGLQDYLEKTIYGYTIATDAYYEAVCHWMKHRHDFQIEKEWIVESPGVVPALYQIVRTFSKPGDQVVILTPVYHPFFTAVEDSNRILVKSPLKVVQNNYMIDFADLEEKLRGPETTMMLLCNPHNPVGRVWSRQELEQVCSLCLQYKVLLISDEIHFDLILPGYTYTSIGQLAPEYVSNSIICTAPSKSFNIAGFQVSNILIADEEKRKRMDAAKGYFSLNLMAYRACEIAYTQCEPWLDALLGVLEHNKKIIQDFFRERLPQIKAFDLQGTYLMWIDFRALCLSQQELQTFLTQKAQWFLNDGAGFGSQGAGFGRMNIACPTHIIEEALIRLEKQISMLNLSGV